MLHICLEGLDASGKSTFSKWIAELIAESGKTIIVDVDRPVMRDEMGSDYDILQKYFDLTSPDVKFFLYAGLAITELQRDRQKLDGIDVLISDRDIASFYIYSRLEEYKFLDLEEYEQIAGRIYDKYPKADITFYLKTDANTTFKRVEERGKNKEYYAEKKNDWWMKLVVLYENWSSRNAIVVDTTDIQKAEELIKATLVEKGVI